SVYSFSEKISPFSAQVFEYIDEKVERYAPDGDTLMENTCLIVEVNADGSISAYDKMLDRPLLSGPGNSLYVYKDIPVAWDGWDIDQDYARSRKKLDASEVRTIETGPVRKVVQATYHYEGSSIMQRYVLNASSKRLDIETEIDWHTRRTLLKAHFPVNLLSREIRCDLSAGHSLRSTRVRNSFEEARFEFPAHRWVEVSEPGFAVSILNDGKYGHACSDSDISLTLLRSPIYPDFFADEGRHSFTYSLFSHDSTNALETVAEAESLNKPLVLASGSVDFGKDCLQISAGNLKVLALKHSEGTGYVLRVAEVEGRCGVASVRTSLPFERCWISNILEDKAHELPVVDGRVQLEYRQFGLHTLIFE
ncbi:MAG: glycoside hydrolase family 38 C-terminal domain-containing protein, partial [Kosmotogaceae bacterium]